MHAISYLGVLTLTGFSMAFLMMMPEMTEITSQMKRNRNHRFFADINMGISHIPTNVTSWLIRKENTRNKKNKKMGDRPDRPGKTRDKVHNSCSGGH